MATEYTELDDKLTQWILDQKMYFVATAPLDGSQRINCSPKGLDTFRVLDTKRVAYLDLTGSGVETIAHIRENGRIVLMWCAFEGPPRILRIYGRAHFHLPGSMEFDELIGAFERKLGERSIIEIEVETVRTSCGFGVPIYQYEGERDALPKWAEKKGEQGVEDYQQLNNLTNIDDLPGLEF